LSRVAFIFRTDVHAADRAPVSWKGDYPGEIRNSLMQIGQLAKQHKANAVLDGGDFFHVKDPVKTSHALVRDIVELHTEHYPCPVYCVEGNHDISGNNLSTLDKQPLGVLLETDVFKPLREEVFESGGVRVRVVGFPYSSTRTLEQIQAVRKQPGDTCLIAVVHALAGENPPANVEDFFGEPVFRYRSLIVEGGPDIFCFGHWHRDQGIVQLEGRHFVNQGAVSRGALIRENLERTPKVALIEVFATGIEVRPLPLKVTPAVEVFDVERKARLEREAFAIDQFVEQLEENTEIDSMSDIDSKLTVLDYAPDVRARAQAYLEKARS
jgi:exonuclease SbcD